MTPGGGSIVGMASGVSDLKAAISSGGVTFTEDSANAMKSSMRQFISTLHGIQQETFKLGQEMPIGETPGAKVYKPFLATVATDPVQGFIPVLKKMTQDAQDVLEAIDKSTKSTQATDEGSAVDVQSISC